MSQTPAQKPQSWMPGMVPTLNHRGFMSETLDRFGMSFVSYAAICGEEVLDMGCAYGVATREVLERGGRVLACDMESGHVEILAREMPPEFRPRLRTAVGKLPEADFPERSFGAILCSRVLHFLTGDEIREAVAKMARWLRPGGRLFLIADTPYTGFWFSIAPDYERRKAAGEEWPAFISNVAPLLQKDELPDGMLAYLNPLDPDLLARECERAGLLIEEAAFTGRGGDPEGRQHAGVIALRR